MSVSCECYELCTYKNPQWADPSSRKDLSGVSVHARMSLSVIRCNNKPLHLHRIDIRGQTKK
jgi:hypothetical protein